MTRPKVYVETTVVSYLVALPTEDIIQMAHQEIICTPEELMEPKP